MSGKKVAWVNPPCVHGDGCVCQQPLDCSRMLDGSDFPEGQPKRARQEDANDCDINVITKRFGITPETPELLERFRASAFGDVTMMPDYRTALDTVEGARGLFMELPPEWRSEFGNDPAVFLDRMHDPDFLAGRAVELGIMKARPDDEAEVEKLAGKIATRVAAASKAPKRDTPKDSPEPDA